MRQRFMDIPTVAELPIPWIFPRKGAKLSHRRVGRRNEYFPLRRIRPSHPKQLRPLFESNDSLLLCCSCVAFPA